MQFLKEEQAQGAIEYILLVGGVIVAAVVIFATYSSMVEGSIDAIDNATTDKVGEIQTAIAAKKP
ncbi:MAG: class III signal peptide-containing protein [Thermodesulfobacteriota bacterium]